MKKILILVLMLGGFSLQASDLKLDASHSRIGFKVPHLMISSVYGNFNNFHGDFKYDEKKGTFSDFQVSIDPSSINTADPKRDKHLRGEDFFDVKKYSEIKFVSDKTIRAKKGGSELKGNLTMHGVTKEISLKVKFKGVMMDPWGNRHLILEISGTINRKDFGLNWNKSLDQGGVMVGDEVELIVEAQGVDK